MKSNSQEPAIAIIAYGSWPTFVLRNLLFDSLEWPVGRPERLKKLHYIMQIHTKRAALIIREHLDRLVCFCIFFNISST